MFEKPTVNDYLAQLRMHHEQSLSEFGKAKLQIQSRASSRGTLQSSMTIIQILEATEAATKNGVAAMLGELRRAIQKTDLDPSELRQLTIPRIEELTSALISAGGWQAAGRWLPSGSSKQLIDDRLTKIREQVTFWIRRFDVGFDQPAEPELIGPVTNVVNARDITGPIQQGQGTLTQTANMRIDAATAARAAGELEVELTKIDLPEETRGEIQSDLATIKAQLQKPTPSVAIVREAGRSVRNITEGVIAGALTPQGLAAAALLAHALGI